MYESKAPTISESKKLISFLKFIGCVLRAVIILILLEALFVLILTYLMLLDTRSFQLPATCPYAIRINATNNLKT